MFKLLGNQIYNGTSKIEWHPFQWAESSISDVASKCHCMHPIIPLAIRHAVKLFTVHICMCIYRNKTTVSVLEPIKNCSFY